MQVVTFALVRKPVCVSIYAYLSIAIEHVREKQKEKKMIDAHMYTHAYILVLYQQ